MSSSTLKNENENYASQDSDVMQGSHLPQNSNKNTNNGKTESEIDELRELIVQSGEVGNVLPDAVRKSSEKDGTLANATLPIVEENIRKSATRNPKILAQALYPVIGPAIRKAIKEALGAMVQSVNQTLEHSVSPRGIGWRIEALRTGKSFGEIVVSKTLLYKVEQVFLIHKNTGLLLQQVSADQTQMQDADMVSAMLTAIQDFVRDSFKTSQDATLDSLKIEELSVWIEHSPDAVIAGVIRGMPPLSLRETFSQAAEEIQYNHEFELKNFDGNSEVFEKSRPILEECIKFQANKKEETSFFKPINIAAALLICSLLITGFFYFRDLYRWTTYVARLKSETGILVTDESRGFFAHSVSGLRDPLSVNPESLVNDYGFESDEVKQNWKIYHDTNDEFILKRAQNTLNPPDGVKLSFNDGVLSAQGKVSRKWIANAKVVSTALLGVEKFQAEDYQKEKLKERIESQIVLFECGTDKLISKQEDKFKDLVNYIEFFADFYGISKINILGHTSKTGSATINENLSWLRSQKVQRMLVNKSDTLNKLAKDNEITFEIMGYSQDKDTKGCAVTLKIVSN